MEGGNLRMRWSGYRVPPIYIYVSLTMHLDITFTSSHVLQYEGFQIRYRGICYLL